ncbi:hypothetical protein ElyMa_003728000 [Elysia marginata]|uniref:CTNNB1 binding N-teminal domain-containing protein n=1 Tax=Elysia marginata TaxID=1093978 RepID=A0AAV4F7G0_9GAST|nr:hypothetical protein ElyMa_003728000 [Elysia marginata]
MKNLALKRWECQSEVNTSVRKVNTRTDNEDKSRERENDKVARSTDEIKSTEETLRENVYECSTPLLVQESSHMEPLQAEEASTDDTEGTHSPNQSNREMERAETEEDVRAEIEDIHKEHGTKKKKEKQTQNHGKKPINYQRRDSGKEYVWRKYT